MDITRSDGVIFVYTLAVMLTGVWLAAPGSPEITPTLVGILVVASIGWTAYFRWTVAGRLLDGEEADGGNDTPADRTGD